MSPKRLQDFWTHRPNNSLLLTTPSQSQITNTYSFCQHFNEHLSHFVYTCMQMPKILIKTQEPPVVIDTEDGLAMLVEIIKEQNFVFVDGFSQERQSYKGYVAWMIIGTQQGKVYVVDAGRLHDQCFTLKQALQRIQLIKFVNQCQQLTSSLKRDWQIFMPNIFDLQIIQRHLSKNNKYPHNPRLSLKQHFISPLFALTSRPLKPAALSKFQNYLESQFHLLLQLDKFFTTSDPSYHSYAYFNHYQFLLKSYYHHTASVKERDEVQRVKREGDAVGKFQKYQQQHKEISSEGVIIGNKSENMWWVKDSQEQKMATMLCEWRQHIAKMRDINSQQVIPYQTISELSKSAITSILQISQLCPSPNSHTPSTPPLYPLSLTDFQQIFELFQLHNQQSQQSSYELSIPRRLPYFKPTQEKPIKELFNEIKFTDVSNDWLNKNTDQSVRLYKQIVSIGEFDNSVIEEYLKEMIKGESTFSVQQTNRFVKYAEYLRVGNHKRLQEVYQKTRGKQQRENTAMGSGKSLLQEQYFEQNFIEGQQEEYKNWDQIQQQINFPTMDTINPPRSNQSLTSLKSTPTLNITQSCQHFITTSSSILKQKQLNSLRLIQSPSIFHKIQPLPKNIQAIYLQAARAKKSYVTKGQKKGNKVGKKEKGKDNGLRKEEEFVPRKEEIFNLVYY